MKIVKQKVCEKSLPPNTDVIKLIYQHMDEPKTNYKTFTDEDLERERQKLLKQLKEGDFDSGIGKDKN